MSRKRAWGIAGLMGVVGCVVFLMAPSSAQEHAQVRSAGRFLKVGAYRVNADWIAYTRDEGDVIVIFFGDAVAPGIRFSGDDSRRVREWLDAQALEQPRGPARRKTIMEGVDINVQPSPGFPTPPERP